MLCLATVSLAAISTSTSTTIINPAISTTPSLPSVPTSTALQDNITFSSLDQPITYPDLPAHLNLTCLNCSTTGIFTLAAGGYNANDSAAHIAMNFFESGFLEFTTQGVGANISTEIALLPGFSIASTRIPLFKKHLFFLPLGELGGIDIFIEIFIPLTLQLNSQVSVFPGLSLSVPDNSTLYLDFGNKNNSFISGFNASTLTPHFNLTAPDLSFTLLTGLDFLLSANSSVGDPSAFDFTGDLAASLGLLILNTTVTELKNVNGTCDAPAPNAKDTIYDKAIGVHHEAKVGLDLSGELAVHVANVSESWAPPAIDLFNRTWALPTECFRFEKEVGGVVPATEAPRATGTLSAVPSAGVDAKAGDSDKKANAASGARLDGKLGKASVVGLVMFVLALVAM